MFRGDVFYVRGTSGGMSAEVLFMMNSHPVNDAFYGSATENYGDIDLDNVKRIEFVSGPASALYGSGAMGGVINIITKEAEDVDGLQITGRGGSFDTWEGNALFGKKFGELEVAGYVDYRNTQGFRGHVEEDQQSLLDRRYGTHASLAPGSMKGDLYQWDAQLTLKYGGLKFDGKYIDRNRDLPFGMSREVLDNTSKFDNRDYYLNLSYDTTITEGLDLMVKAYQNQHAMKIHNQIFGKGSLIMTPTGPMVTSVDRFVEAWNKSSRMGGEAQVTYKIIHSNTLVGGITFEQQKSYDNKGRGNILVTSNPYVFIVRPSVQDNPPGRPNPDMKRDVWAAYLEDIWDILDDLRLTIGGRYDHYSDFGGQFSPRVGINWEFADNFNTKFLYGESFRAPYFLDLYDSTFGNPNLKSETQQTFELSFGANFHPFSAQITAFQNRLKDAITGSVVGSPPTYKYMNADRITRTGAELQLKYDFGRGTYLSANYTQMTWDFADESIVAWMEPARFGTLTGNVRLNKYLNFNAQLLYRGNWSRSKNDPREDPGDYAIVNATLIAKDFINELKGLEVRGSVLNLFNKDYTAPTGPGELPNDYPMPGINFFVELRYSF
jgi:outer membrane receptor protein involved in Fe transport